MLHLIYYFSFIAALAFFPVQIHFYKKSSSVYYAALFISIIINAMGTLQLSYAQSIEAAIFANDTIYLGAAFSPFFSFLCIADLIKFKVSWLFKAIGFGLGCVVFACVVTVGVYPFYYKSISVETWHGLSYMVKEYGSLHIIYPIYMFIMAGASLLLIVHAFRKRRQISYVTTLTLFIVLLISLLTYILERALHSKIEFIPLSMNIEQFALLFLLRRISMYDISGITTSTMLKSRTYGFVSFKEDGKFLGMEGEAAFWFPELNSLYVDSVVSADIVEISALCKQINKWREGKGRDEVAIFEVNERIIQAKYSVVPRKGGSEIHMITLIDDTEQQKLNRIIKDYNENLEAKVYEKTQTLRLVQDDIIRGFADAVETRDGNTGGHIKRTSDIVRIFVDVLRKNDKFSELTPYMAECIIKAAPLHDLGKIGVQDSILNKPGKFTDEEYEIMKTHPAKGAVLVAKLLKNSEDKYFKEIAINIAHYHHEKWNGKGYPAGLSKEYIPFEARVMALADVFDALVSRRVYKEQFSYDTAFKIIEDSCGEHFDPDLCAEFLKCRPQLEELYNSYPN